MHAYRLLAAAAAFLLWATPVSAKKYSIEEYSAGSQLSADHGYMVFGTHSPNPDIKIRFKSGGDSYRTTAFPAGHAYKMLILPAGKYVMESISRGPGTYRPSDGSSLVDWEFTIQPGKINYMGELTVSGNSVSQFRNEKTIRQILEHMWPSLYETHDLVDAKE